MSRKIALVTGASSGLGLEISRQLVKEHGYAVIGSGRSQSALEALGNELGAEFQAISGDLNEADTRDRLVAEVVKRGRLDLFVNNAAVTRIENFSRLTEAEIHQILGTNVVAPTLLTHLFFPWLEKSNGILLNISSVLGHFAVPYHVLYSATKHYLNGFGRGLRLESQNVRVINACPGNFRSNFVRNGLGKRQAQESYTNSGAEASLIASRILRKLDQRSLWIFPTWGSLFFGWSGRYLSWPADFALRKLAHARMQKKFPEA